MMKNQMKLLLRLDDKNNPFFLWYYINLFKEAEACG